MPDPQAEAQCMDRRLRRFDRCSADSQNLLPFAAFAVSRPSRLDVAREKHRPDPWSISYPKPSSPGQTGKEAPPARLGPMTDGHRECPWRVHPQSNSGVHRPTWQRRGSGRKKLRRQGPAPEVGLDTARSDRPAGPVVLANTKAEAGPALDWLTIRPGAPMPKRPS